TDQMARQCPRLKPAPRVQFAKLRHRLLDDTTAEPHAAHKTPVAMDFAVLLQRRVAQVHALITTQPSSNENGEGWHYTPSPSPRPFQPFDLAQPGRSKKEKLTSNCASWVKIPDIWWVEAGMRDFKSHRNAYQGSRPSTTNDKMIVTLVDSIGVAPRGPNVPNF